MEDPTNRVVDRLGLGEALVATLVGNDPKTCSGETRPEPVLKQKDLCERRVQDQSGWATHEVPKAELESLRSVVAECALVEGESTKRQGQNELKRIRTARARRERTRARPA